MTVVQASGTPCSSPDWTCLTVDSKATVPTASDGGALVKVSSSSVNPIDTDLVEPAILYRRSRSGGLHACGNNPHHWSHCLAVVS